MRAATLAGCRVLLVEDELLVAMLIEDTLADEDCVVVGPFASLSDAMQAAEAAVVDVAVLDVNLRGEKVYPVAEILAKRGIPFLLLSGYGTGAVPPNRPHWQAVGKPFIADELVTRLLAQIPNMKNGLGDR